MALQARAVVDRKDLGEALENTAKLAEPGSDGAKSVGRALSYPARKLYDTGKRIEQQYAKGGKVAPNNRFGFATPNKYAKK